MKFKLGIMTLLVVGLVFGLSGIASANAVISLLDQNTNNYVLDDSVDSDIAGVPMLYFSVTNTEATAITLTAVTVTNSAATAQAAADIFQAQVWKDANGNGVLDKDDVSLIALTNLAQAADATTALDITDQTIASMGSLTLIVTVKKLGTAEPADIIELILDDANALTITEAPTVADTATASLNAGTAANVPQITIADGAGSVSAAVHTIPLTDGLFPNMKAGQMVHKFKITGDDLAISHVLDGLRLTSAATIAAPPDVDGITAADFDNLRVFIDANNTGMVEASDPELLLDTATFDGSNTAVNDYAILTPVVIYNKTSINFIATLDGQGTGHNGEAMELQLTAAGTTIDGGIVTQDNVAGAEMTMDALVVVMEANDVNSNGWDDAVKLTFLKGSDDTPINVQDATLAFTADWNVVFGTAGNATELALNATHNGDVADNSVAYLRVTEIQVYNTVASNSAATNATPSVSYVAGTRVVDASGMYALTDIPVAVLAEDKAGAARMAFKTLDPDHNGFINGFEITFSEIVHISEAGKAKLRSAFVIDQQRTNTLDMSSATITVAGKVVTLIGTSTEANGWDTADLPRTDFGADNGILDDSVAQNAAASWSNTSPTDGAQPILMMAVGQVGSANIRTIFSEPVTKSGGGALDATVFNYINVYAPSTPLAAASVNDAGDADGATFKVVVNGTLSLDHVLVDKLATLVGIVDPTGNIAVLSQVPIADLETPTLVAAYTRDLSLDGWVDTIELVFSENINDENIAGYRGTNKIFGPTKDFFTVTGFEVIGVNSTVVGTGSWWNPDPVAGTVSNASSAKSDGVSWGFVRGSDIIPNVLDVANDETIYLAVRPLNMDVLQGNTGLLPKMSITGGAAGCGIGDFQPNYLDSITDFQVTDGAGPQILTAEMPTNTTMILTFSEVLGQPGSSNGSPLSVPITWVASEKFEWLVGSELVDYAGDPDADDDGVPDYAGEGSRAINAVLNIGLAEPGYNVRKLKLTLQEYHAIPAGVVSQIRLLPDAVCDQVLPPLQNFNTLPDPEWVSGWIRDLIAPESTVSVEEAAAPVEFALGKNFPNPFNPSTTISYDVASEGRVSITVYNINGQKVRTLVDETKAPGFYNVVWNGKNDMGEDVASGVYLYRMESASFSKLQKMTFIK